MKNNVAIIGFMGSGKTTIGKLLAERLDYIFIDLDRLVEIAEDKTIKDIFNESGEGYFREIESSITRKIINNKKCVFACGGGIILKKENMDKITDNCDIVYLKISEKEAFSRLIESTERPLIPEKEKEKEISDIFKKRKELYSKYGEIVIDNENILPEEAVNIIIEKLKKQNQ